MTTFNSDIQMYSAAVPLLKEEARAHERHVEKLKKIIADLEGEPVRRRRRSVKRKPAARRTKRRISAAGLARIREGQKKRRQAERKAKSAKK